MVRIKHRYLLVNILYPSEAPTKLKFSGNDIPDLVKFHQPSPEQLLAAEVKRLIVNNISLLFGDYGGGTIGGSLQGQFPFALAWRALPVACSHCRAFLQDLSC
jgi:ribonuclease P/MRP protein subunit POP5